MGLIDDLRPPTGSDMPVGTVVQAGVDWITCTAKDPERRQALADLGYAQYLLERNAGHDTRPYSRYGYEGLHAGAVTFAQRDDSTLLQLSSDKADKLWAEALKWADNCSRLDTQVTVRFNSEQRDLGVLAYVGASAVSQERGRPLGVTLVVDNKGGSTCYLGSRASDSFGRVYNKAAESGEKEYRNCWRYEVESKNGQAFELAKWVRDGEDWRAQTRAHVWDYLAYRGVYVPFSRDGQIVPFKSAHRRSDDDRTLQWFEEQIRPCIADLQGRLPKARIFEALGLDDPQARERRRGGGDIEKP